MPAWSIALLGPLALSVDGAATELPGRGERALLSLLALDVGRRVSTERLVGSLWADEHMPADPTNALQLRVSKLRRVVGDVVVTEPGGYCLHLPVERVDAHRFRQLVARDRPRDALALWRGTPLAEFMGEGWADIERTALQEERLQAVADRVDEDLEAGRHAAVVTELDRLVADHPANERFWAQLMLARYRAEQQAAALATFRRARERLAEEFGLDPGPRLVRLEQAILRQDPALDAAVGPPARPAAPLGPTLGRADELADCRQALGDHRLVTLLGPGGVGKSRLAAEVAAAAGPSFPDGAVVVHLGEVGHPDGVVRAVATAAGIDQRHGATDEELLAAWFARRESLLVLDGCEHVIEEVAGLVQRLLAAAPSLTALVTSRVPLELPGGRDLQVGPLPIAAAAELFRLRSREAGGGGAAGGGEQDDHDAIVAIVTQLDGLPLAIELAAAWARSLAPAAIARELGGGLDLLDRRAVVAPGRPRTLREVVASSLDLLDDTEAVLFRRLSVFVARWTTEDAAAVCGGAPIDGDDVLAPLLRLVEQSLVVAEGGRFRMLATVAHVAAERLAEAGETQVLEKRHARHFLAHASGAEAGLRGPDQRRWLERLRGSASDTAAALAWGRQHAAPEDVLLAAAGLGWFWFLGRHGDGRRELAAALDAAPDRRDVSPLARGRALQAQSIVRRPGGCIVHPDAASHDLAVASRDLLAAAGAPRRAALSVVMVEVAAVGGGGDVGGALARLADARAGLLDAGDEWGAALADFVAMEIHVQQGGIDDAVDVGERARGEFEAVGDAWGTSSVALHLGHGLRIAGRTDAAAALLEVGREQASRAGILNTLAGIHDDLARIALHRREPTAVNRSVARLRSLAEDLGNRMLRGTADVIEATLLQERGRPDQARRLLRSATALLEEEGVPGGLAEALVLLAVDGVDRGDLGAAGRHARRAESLARSMHDQGLQARAVEALALVAAAGGEHTDAATALGRAASVRREGGRPAGRTELVVVDRTAALCREVLGSGRFDELVGAAGATGTGVSPSP